MAHLRCTSHLPRLFWHSQEPWPTHVRIWCVDCWLSPPVVTRSDGLATICRQTPLWSAVPEGYDGSIHPPRSCRLALHLGVRFEITGCHEQGMRTRHSFSLCSHLDAALRLNGAESAVATPLKRKDGK
jgi:hypothetical protein